MKNKLISIILIFFIVFISIFNTYSFGAKCEYTYTASNGVIYEFNIPKSEIHPYYFFYIDNSLNIKIYYLTETEKDKLIYGDVKNVNGTLLGKGFIFGGSTFYRFFNTTLISVNNFSVPSIETSKSNSFYSSDDNFYTETVKLYSNFDIKDKDGNVVFYPAPLVGEQIEILPTITTSMDFSMVQKEILEILPVILIMLIGLLALRKAIQLLFQMLHRT